MHVMELPGIIKPKRIDIDEPRWSQETYLGRAKHFFATTNPLNLLASSEKLERSRDIVTRYKNGEDIPGLSEDELWSAKQLYDSAYHPETGEKVFWVGRMSAQVPANMFLTGSMLNFYKRLALSYVCATAGSVIAAVGFGSLAKNAHPFMKRLIPFTAVAAGNCVNLPIMRSKELIEGVPVYDDKRAEMGNSRIAARDGIAQVVLSRIAMAVPPMIFPPIVMNRLERKGILGRNPRMEKPVQVILVGICLIFATPMCCALFSQNSSISVRRLEPEIQERVKKIPNPPTTLYYNKGL